MTPVLALCCQPSGRGMPDRIELVTGSGAWLERAHRAFLAMAALSLALTHTPLAWKLAALAALLVISLVERQAWRQMRSRTRRILKRVGEDIVSPTEQAYWQLRQGRVWISRWFCVFRLEDRDTGKGILCLVCASENHPDDYRRLLVWLRMAPLGDQRMMAW